MPPSPISRPERMKKGIASSVKLLIPVAICCATVVTAGTGAMVQSIVRRVDTAIQIAIGTFIINRKIKLTISIYTEVSIVSPKSVTNESSNH